VNTQIDHLVVAAATLDDGVAWCEATLGITPGPGGKHPLMGTHNRLFDISSPAFPQCFFEIIAIDPEAPVPARPRWFGLDRLDLIAGPRLVHAVARTAMIEMHRWGLINVGLQPGDPVAAERGGYRWRILLRGDGALPAGGALPTLIEWQGAHPCEAMAPSGVTLQTLELNGFPERARDVLRLSSVAHGGAAGPPLSAGLSTPRGPVELRSV
jgi:hypothetical protein